MSELQNKNTENVEILYGFEYLVNTGDFENAKVILHVKASPRDGETPGDAADRIANFVEGKVVARVQDIRAQLGK